MKFLNTEIPDWLQVQLEDESPDPNFNNIIELLLRDYIKRNAPVIVIPTEEKIFTTVGIYANWKSLGVSGYVVNGVLGADLLEHIEYNRKFRPGRALFVNGKLTRRGYLSIKDCVEWSNRLKDDSKFTMTTVTRPYK